MNPEEINCAEACINGCILGDRCPNREYQTQASQFIKEKSLDDILAIAEAALRKKASAPPQWILPDQE